MPNPAVTPEAPAVSTNTEIETPGSLEEALETGFLPADPHYRLTGEFKQESSEKKEASAASPEVKHKETPSEKESVSATDGADTRAASAAATTQETKGPAQTKTAQTSETRWAKRERELKEARAEIARLKAAQPQPRSDSPETSQPRAEAAPAAQTNPNPRPKIDDVDPKTGKAKYATYGDYEAAKDEWLKKETLREFTETSQKTQREQELGRAERTLAEGFAKKLETSRKSHQDFDQVALNPDLVIPKGSVADGFLLDSEHAGEVLYYLGQHPEILEGFYGQHDPKTGKYVNKITPFAQARELTKIELQLSGQSHSQEKAPAKPITQAPRPPNQVDGKGTVAKDTLEDAVEQGDSETYMREANARALARLKKGK